ncbi:hypothetical protein [Nonomuraea bangladeshensis]|uniref:hypothetical protein n=1 Tax=Nonomuraea bangladeshensis TaxID=404385 RepID=UPI003C302B43
MIGHAHIEALREQVARAQRELAGWEQLLAHAERASNGTVMPDPLMPAGQAWPLPAPEPWQPPAEPVAGRDPYPVTSVLPPIDGSELPGRQEAALGAIASEHDAYAQSRDGVKEERKWEAS